MSDALPCPATVASGEENSAVHTRVGHDVAARNPADLIVEKTNAVQRDIEATIHTRPVAGPVDGLPDRTMFAHGDEDAEREAQLMVAEKVDAMFEAGASMMAGASAATVIGRYREHVAANTKRLSSS